MRNVLDRICKDVSGGQNVPGVHVLVCCQDVQLYMG